MSKYIVLFEVVPAVDVDTGDTCMARYLELAAMLRPMLNGFDGFISAERFQSLANERKILSMNVWESEEAMTKWRSITEHRMSQLEGRNKLFESYKISVTKVMREYTDKDRTEAPADSNEYFG